MKDELLFWGFWGCFFGTVIGAVIVLALSANSESWSPIDNQGNCVLHTYTDKRLFGGDTEELTIYCKSDILTK